MPEEKPIPPEHESESKDDAAKDEETLNDALSESSVNPVVPEFPDVHDLPTLIDLEKNDDDETDDILPVRQPPEARSDVRRTLPGSGGYDPNPDFTKEQEGGQTVPHIVPFEHTLVHVPGEEPPPARSCLLYTSPSPRDG